jgi:hypothetical protein
VDVCFSLEERDKEMERIGRRGGRELTGELERMDGYAYAAAEWD